MSFSLASQSVSNDISVRDLKVKFKQDEILKGIDLDFPHSSLTMILGPSGTGKSVFLKVLLGLIRPSSGQIQMLGKDYLGLSNSELFKFRKNFGMLFQNSALFDDETLFDNVAFPLREDRVQEEIVEIKVTQVLEKLELRKPWTKLPNEISGGMKKRVALARAIIRKPKILFYDEPTTGLDPVTRNTVDDLILKLKNENLTSIVVSHDIPAALEIADLVAFFYQGKVIYHGPPKGLFDQTHHEIQRFINAEKRTLTALEEVCGS